MNVTVDHEPLAVKELGLQTIGQVLSHLQRDNRLVVQVLIDGEEPDPDCLPRIRQEAIGQRCIYIETADPRVLALDVLSEIEVQLQEADSYKSKAAELLQQNQTSRAMESLAGLMRIWQDAQESVLKTAQVLRIDLGRVEVEGQPLQEVVERFSEALRLIRSSLEQRDYVSLSDVLMYETADTTAMWLACIGAMRGEIGKA